MAFVQLEGLGSEKGEFVFDWDQVNEQRPEWNARWNRSIER
ncbi:hypothetical protein [Pseudomonas sp. BGI-2]|nr:hypothetical protein [Pseudomonas sp. BGI-2]